MLVVAPHSAPSSMLSSMLPWIGITIAERLRDRGSDISIRSDDPSKHAKSYRQIPSSIGKIPPRDAHPSDALNIHSALLERCGIIRSDYSKGSITAFPIIETINCDTTESTATNVISITDGQIHTDRSLLLDGSPPAIDSGPSATRIGSNAQCKLLKIPPSGIKNEFTNYRIAFGSSSSSASSAPASLNRIKFLSLNPIFFQDHLIVPSIETTLIPLSAFRSGILLSLRPFHFLLSF